MSNLIHNERVKLFATFVNTISAGTFLGAIFIPTTLALRTDQISIPHGLRFVLVGLVISWAMSLLAQWSLRRLKE